MEHYSVPENRVGAAKQGLSQVAWNRTSQGAGKRLITRLYGKEQARTTPGGMLTPYCTNPQIPVRVVGCRQMANPRPIAAHGARSGFRIW